MRYAPRALLATSRATSTALGRLATSVPLPCAWLSSLRSRARPVHQPPPLVPSSLAYIPPRPPEDNSDVSVLPGPVVTSKSSDTDVFDGDLSELPEPQCPECDDFPIGRSCSVCGHEAVEV